MVDKGESQPSYRRVEVDLIDSNRLWAILKILIPSIMIVLSSIVGGLLAYRSASSDYHDANLNKMRSDAYVDYANAYVKFRVNQQDAVIVGNQQAQVRVALFGDDDVVKSLAKAASLQAMRKCGNPDIVGLDFWIKMRSHVTGDNRVEEIKPYVAILVFGCTLT